jgi:DNA-directed RNA polymerase subunit RPC12/RpoP
VIHFPCRHCGAQLRVPEEQAGRTGRCPRCRGKVTVPPRPATENPADKVTAGGPTGTRRKPLDGALLDLPPRPDRPVSPPGTAARETASPDTGTLRPAFDFLLYPLNVSGIIHLLIFSLLPPWWARASTLRFWMAPGIGPLCWLVVLTLYFVHYLATCLSDSAQGGTRAVDINSAGTPLSTDALLSTFGTIFPVIALAWGPPLAYGLLKGHTDWVLALWVPAVGFVFPMTLLAVNYFDSVRGANPMLVLPSIASVLGSYCVLVLCLSALSGLGGLLMYLSGGPHGGWLARPPLIYVFLVQTRLLGGFYRRYQERLDWGV